MNEEAEPKPRGIEKLRQTVANASKEALALWKQTPGEYLAATGLLLTPVFLVQSILFKAVHLEVAAIPLDIAAITSVAVAASGVGKFWFELGQKAIKNCSLKSK